MIHYGKSVNKQTNKQTNKQGLANKPSYSAILFNQEYI